MTPDESSPAAAPARPQLATDAQLAAERRLVATMEDPELKALQRRIRGELLALPRGRLAASVASIDESIEQWTRSLVMAEIIEHSAATTVLWMVDDTPRTWCGYTLPGVGMSGDNPDAVYRCAVMDGTGTYEMVGRFPAEGRAAQIVVQVDPGSIARPTMTLVPTANPGKHFEHVALLTDDFLPVAADGSFRITFGPDEGGADHYRMPPGLIGFSTRDLLSDWTQRPCDYVLRRIDRPETAGFDEAGFRAGVLADLPVFIDFWRRFPDIWLKGLEPNRRSGMVQRAGGWGCQLGMRFELGEDEVMLVTVSPSKARYTGFQVMNPWMIAADARRSQCCLNGSQVVANADGSITYIIAPEDPGLVNWLDTTGWREGFGLMRWQAVPPDFETEGMVRDFRVIPRAELDAMPDLPRVSPQERAATLARRDRDYSTRAT